jgi:hypothetical protein
MNNAAKTNEIEDLCECARTGRRPRNHGPYRVLLGNSLLEYSPMVMDDPVPTGRQILQAANFHPHEEYLLFQMLKGGLLEEVRPEETTDLREKGIERFLVFKNDRSFRFQLDGVVLEWGGNFISGLTLKKLAGVNPDDYGVWLEVRGSDDRLIANDELVDLGAPGIERFFTGIIKTTEGCR